ncbi:MAG: dephospho-CoA kinase [Clostridia bacterium]
MKFAIIGGMGSGKSSVTQCLAARGKHTYDCDIIARGIMEEDSYIALVDECFPGVVKNGIVDRKLLGNIVFNDKSKLELLNSLIHPLVKSRLKSFAKLCGKNDFFVEVSAYIGSGLEEFFDKVICVVADEEVRIDRAMQHNGYSREHCLSILRSQPSQQQLTDISDFVIYNDKDFEYLYSQIEDVLEQCKI